MRKFLLISLLLVVQVPLNAQDTNRKSTPVPGEKKVRFGFGFVPSKPTHIYGWAVGYLVLGHKEDEKNTFIINGIYTNLSPLQPIWGVMAAPIVVTLPVKKITTDKYSEPDSIEYRHRINGIALSLLESSGRFVINGLKVSVVMHSMPGLNGISATAGAAIFESFNGITVAGIFNSTLKGKGLQIGLVNFANEMTGLQIGLWNRIGDKRLPLLNLGMMKKIETFCCEF